MKLTEYVQGKGGSMDSAREALKALRKVSKLPSPETTLSAAEASQLNDLVSGDDTPIQNKEAIAKVDADMQEVIADLQSRLAKAEGQLQDSADEDISPFELASRVSAMEAAIRPGAKPSGPTVGHSVSVKRGDLIANDLTLNPGNVVQGGWRKAEEDEKATKVTPLISVAVADFSYDSARGVAYHTIRHQPYRQFRKNGGDTVVGSREIKESILT
jgi:hypothetical protein